MKIRTEISEREEIIIRCKERTDKIQALEAAIEEVLRGEQTLTLSDGNTDYFVPKAEILFFESADGKVYAHTCVRIYTAPYKLFELESVMPASFVRVSKSAIVNLHELASIRRELVGNGELTFRNCEKTVWFSRAYYKLLQYKLEELRFTK